MAAVAASSDVFRAVADPTRRNLLAMLVDSDRTVRDLCEPFHMTQPAISQHLKILSQAGLVTSRPAGRERYYRLNSKPLEEVYVWASRFVQLKDPAGHLWRMVARPDPHRAKRSD